MSFHPLVPPSNCLHKEPPSVKQVGVILKSKRPRVPSDSYRTTALEPLSRTAGKYLLNFVCIQLTSVYPHASAVLWLFFLLLNSLSLETKESLEFDFPRLNERSSSKFLVGDELPVFAIAQACLCSSLSLTFAGGDDQNQTKTPKWEPSGLTLPPFFSAFLKIIHQIRVRYIFALFAFFFFPRPHHFRGSLTFRD